MRKMPTIYATAKNQEEAEEIKSKIPDMVAALGCLPETTECYIGIDNFSKCIVYLHDKPERRASEYRQELLSKMKYILGIEHVELVFVKLENWIDKQEVIERCANSKH